MEIYKHANGEFLRLIKLRKSGVNTFVQCTEQGEDIVIKRTWSEHPEEQRRIVKGFDKLKKVN